MNANADLAKTADALTELHATLVQGPPVPVKQIRRMAMEVLDRLPAEATCPRWEILAKCDKAREAASRLVDECRGIEKIQGGDSWFEPGEVVPWTDRDKQDITAARNAIVGELLPKQPSWLPEPNDDSGQEAREWSRLVTQKDLRTKLGISQDTLKERLTDGLMPVSGRYRCRKAKPTSRKIEVVVQDLPDSLHNWLRKTI